MCTHVHVMYVCMHVYVYVYMYMWRTRKGRRRRRKQAIILYRVAGQLRWPLIQVSLNCEHELTGVVTILHLACSDRVSTKHLFGLLAASPYFGLGLFCPPPPVLYSK